MERHWNYWDDGSYRHIFIAPLTGGAEVTGGTDIMPGEPWDAPTAPYFDISEIAWNRAGTQLAYTCKKLTGKAYALSTDSDVYLYDLASGQTRNLTEGNARVRQISGFLAGRFDVGVHQYGAGRATSRTRADCSSKRWLTGGKTLPDPELRLQCGKRALGRERDVVFHCACAGNLSGVPGRPGGRFGARADRRGARCQCDYAERGRTGRRSDFAVRSDRTFQDRSGGRNDDPDHEYQSGNLRSYPDGGGARTLGTDYRRPANVDVGCAAAGFRFDRTLSGAAVLSGEDRKAS